MGTPNKGYAEKYTIAYSHDNITDHTSFYSALKATTQADFDTAAHKFAYLAEQFLSSLVTIESAVGHDVNGIPTFSTTFASGFLGIIDIGPDGKPSNSTQLRLSGKGAKVGSDSTGRKAELVFTGDIVLVSRGARKIALSSFANYPGIQIALSAVAPALCDYRGGLLTLNSYVTQKQNSYLMKKRGF